MNYTAEGSDAIMDFVRSVMPLNQHALQQISHGFYSNYGVPTSNDKSRLIDRIGYLDAGIQDFGSSFRINNLYRNRTVILSTTQNLKQTTQIDTTMGTFGNFKTSGQSYEDPTVYSYEKQCSSHYASLRNRIDNQYGQIESISQLPIPSCMHPISQTTTDVLFGGDIYINRYTLFHLISKNIFF